MNEGIVGKCKLCASEIHGYMNVTSNFYRHLKTKHGDSYNKLILSAPEKNEKNKILDSALMKCIADNMIPIAFIESDSFKQFVAILDKKYKVPSRPTAMKSLINNFEKIKNNIKLSIKSVEVVCTTADIWSTKTRSFLGYTCHWIDAHFARHSAALACKRFEGCHSYDRIHDIIQEIHNEYSLNNLNVIATVTDNGSNFIKTFKEFGIDNYFENGEQVLEEDEYQCMSEEMANRLPKHIRCASHTLNLLATTDFEKNILNCGAQELHKKVTFPLLD